MKVKTIIRCSVFLLGLLGLLILSSLFFQPKNNTESAGMEDVAANGILGEPKQTIDVLFIGDSVSYCSVIPVQIWRDYGITSYMCGTSLQQLYYSKEFLYKAFETQTPKVVMLEATPVFSNFEYKENIRMAVERMFPIFRYHDRWKDFDTLLEADAGLKPEYTHLEVNKGYYYSTAIETAGVEDYAKPTEDVAGILDDNKQTLIEIKRYCEKMGVRLILYSAPNTVTWRPDCHNALVLLAEELELTYFDMNYMTQEIPIDWRRDSFDGGDHLNYYGAQKVTAYLGEYLAEMQLFEDKREYGAYDSWNDAQELFYEGKTQ